MSAIPLLFFKAHVKAHDRRLPSGKVIRVKEYEDGRVKLQSLKNLNEQALTYFAALGHERVSAETTLADAQRLSGIHWDVPIEMVALDDINTRQQFDPATGRIEINVNVSSSRSVAAQAMAEELLHALDNAGTKRQYSPSSSLLAMRFKAGDIVPDGGIAREALKNNEDRTPMGRYLDYPILTPGLTIGRIQAELFARLGVLYIANPEWLRRDAPKTYEAYHEFFKTIHEQNQLRPQPGQAIHGNVPGGSISPARAAGGGGYLSDGRVRKTRGTGIENRPAGRLEPTHIERIRRKLVSTFKANPNGRLIQQRLSSEALDDAQYETIDGTTLKSITLILPSGNEYQLNQGQYRWQVSNLLLKALGSGERWITVHPSGNKDAKGVPVLVRESQTGSGVYHVIGGAGGKLNYLRLRGLKPESDYKAQARERAANKRQAKLEQARQERESGTAGVKNAQREAVNQQQRQQEAQFVEQVAKVMGWDEKDYKFDGNDHRNLSEVAMRKAADRHHREVLQRAMEAVEVQRERLIADPDLRAAAGLETLPAHSDIAHQLSVDDIDPVTPPGTTLGFAPKYEQRAAAAGASPEVIKQEAEAVKDERLTPEQREAAIKRGETREAVKKELEDIRQPAKEDLKIELVEAQQAVELLKMKKQLRAVQQKAKAARADINKDQSGKVKAYNLTVGDEPDLDDKVKADLENDIRTAQTRAFLSTVRETGGTDYEQTLNAAIGGGSFNSINALAITAGGAALVDRSVVDVLGPAGAAQVLARRLHSDLDAETVSQLTEGFEDFHLNHYMETSKAALDQAANLQAEAKKLQIDEASDATDLALAKSLTEKRMKAIAESQRLLGTALGEMEANAALVAALKAGRTDTPLEVPLGGISPEEAIKQARAIGLQRGDYRLDKVDGNEILTVSPEGLDRLAKPVDVAELRRTRRNLDIIEGREDEENWLPKGVANRADLAMPPVNPGVADVLAKPFAPGDDLEQSLKDYIGGRMADGDAPADIISDIQSQTFFDKAGVDRFNDYMAALDAVAPLKDAKGKARPVENLRPDFEKLADDFVERHYGGTRSPLHRQTFDPNDTAAAESLYRSLAEVPEGIVAYKPIGELTNQDQRALREYFHANVAREDENAVELRHQLEDLSRNEPEKEFEDMFGEVAENPEWREWKSQRDSLAEQVNRAKLSWDKYVTLQRGQANAYASLQDLIKSRVTEKFIDHYNWAHADKPLKTGRTVIRNHLAHADAIDPALRESRLEEQRQFNARLQARNAGKFASDDVIGKQQAAREADEAMRQAQFSLFGDEDTPEAQSTPLRADERHTLGHAAENQISRMVPMMARNFKPGQPFQMWQPSMNGKGVARQRAIKLIESNKHQILALGTGGGKTLVQLGAFAHLQQTGKAKRGLFLCPSIVQSEFRGEAARYLDPHANNGQGFSYHIEPGASREERIAAYKDPKHHFAVMTHSAFRDDMLHLGAQQAGIGKDEMSAHMSAMRPDEQAVWLKSVMDQEGINFDYVALDEAQVALNREGKKDSALAGIVGALSRNSPYFVMASADPVKNDKSEIFSALNFMDAERYSDRAAFMRRYGADTPGSQDALRAELTNYVYAHKIDPEGVKALKKTVSVDLNDEQHQAITDLRKHLASARMARMSGKVDVPAVKALMPERFDGVPDAQHEAVAKELQRNLGLAKEAAMGRIIDDRSVSAKYAKAVELANQRKGKPGIIFAHRIESVNELAKKLEAEGHSVTVLTGKDSPDEKARKVREYKAKGGILVASDAASTGMNAQNAQWVVQYDTPQTAMTHAQRGARAYRTGQKNDVELIDLVANHDHERKARDRLVKKYELRDLMTSPLESSDDSGLAYFLKQRDSQQWGLF